ncbi:MAG: hypothetical protein ABIJ75_02470 [Actinomycetota bacterium]
MTDLNLPEADSFDAAPEGLRDAYKRAKKIIADQQGVIGTLEVEVKGTRIASVFPPGTPGHQVLADFYDGDLTNVEAMTEFAGRYGHVPEVATDPETGGRRRQEAKVEAIRTDPRTGVVGAPKGREAELEAEIHRLESEGKYTETIALKNELGALRKG